MVMDSSPFSFALVWCNRLVFAMSFNMLRINLNAKAWRNLRRLYADQPISPVLALQNRFSSMWLSILERIACTLSKTSAKPPEVIFIIGHWRSGTTFVHEILCQNQNVNFPTTYACMNPQVFPITEATVLNYSVKRSSLRPMDNMSITSASPQEDEFALLALGARSPYEGLLFPKAIERGLAAADPNDLTEIEMQEWVCVFTRFIDQVSTRKPGCPVVLKSPTHSYRVKLLSRLFPDARFIHIVRNPLDVYSSTLNMWWKLCSLYSLTDLPDENMLSGNIVANWIRMEEKLDAAIPGLREENYVRIHYESLTAHPAREMERIYTKLRLGGFATALAYIEKLHPFKKNRFELTPDKANEVFLAWEHIFDKYGYPSPTCSV